jgi:hypothetical protein
VLRRRPQCFACLPWMCAARLMACTFSAACFGYGLQIMFYETEARSRARVNFRAVRVPRSSPPLAWKDFSGTKAKLYSHGVWLHLLAELYSREMMFKTKRYQE